MVLWGLNNKKAKGVAIGMARNTQFMLRERLVFLKGKVYNIECTLANIYCSNKNPIRYLEETIRKLIEFKEGYVILAGELHFCLNPNR